MDFIELFPMIEKRKSYRDFDSTRQLDVSSVEALLKSYECVLLGEEKPIIKVVPASSTSCPKGDVCICYYGSRDERGLLEAGFYLEQLDLFLQLNGIGICWYGFGRTKIKNVDDKEFVIMLNAGYAKEGSLRSDISEFKRNDKSSFWSGDSHLSLADYVRLTPSSCNTQPWLVESEENKLIVRRGKGNFSIMRGKIKDYFNTIDMGIFLCFLELAMKKDGIEYTRTLLTDSCIAQYNLG